MRVRSLPKPAPNYMGFFDSFDGDVARGWALDRSNPAQSIVLHVIVDGQEVGQVSAEHHREDLLHNLGREESRCGFAFAIPAALADGTHHTIGFRLPNRMPLNVFNPSAPDAPGDHMTFKIPAYQVQGYVDGIRGGKITGWAIRRYRSGHEGRGGCQIEVTASGRRIGIVRANVRRQDVATAIDCDPNCGFELLPPPDLSRAMPHTFTVKVVPDGLELTNSPITSTLTDDQLVVQLARLTDNMDRLFRDFVDLRRQVDMLAPTPPTTLDQYDTWARAYYQNLTKRVAASRVERVDPPLVSVILPAYRPLMFDFNAAIESVLSQTYQHWELIIVDDASRSKELRAQMQAFCQRDSRIRAITRKTNGNISEATNTAIEAARGEWVALFDHDDVLVDEALEVMVNAAIATGADLLYSDEDKIDKDGVFSQPNFKPDWDHRYMLGCNYACHLSMVRRRVLETVGPFRTRYNGAQDHDIMLRIAEAVPASRIHHVPELLYHWRITPNSTAADMSNKDYAREAGVAAVQHHLDRIGWPATVSSINGLTIYRVDWQSNSTPTVCVIIPFREQIGMTRRCLDHVLHNRYSKLEVLLVDNWSTSSEAAAFTAAAATIPGVKVFRIEEPFNYSRINNKAVEQTNAQMICFLNNDMLVDDGWLTAALGEFIDPEVGAVGGLFRYPDGNVQHAGVSVGPAAIAVHGQAGQPATDYGYIGRVALSHQVTAVTAAGMLVPRAVFNQVGGFDETLTVAYNDVDLCLKIREAGHRIVYCASWTAEHHESYSRGSDDNPIHEKRFFYERQHMLDRWSGHEIFERDPAYSRFFAIDRRPFFDLQPPDKT